MGAVMKWKILKSIPESVELFTLPRKVGFEVEPGRGPTYYFSYLSSSSGKSKTYELDGAKINVERGSNKILYVVLDEALKGAGNEVCDNKMRMAVYKFFKIDGAIDSRESKFLSVLDKEIIRTKAFG